MDWHASVYGSRSGGGQYRDFSDGDADDDGVTYGARGSYADMADDTAGATPLPPSVDDAELRRLGGNAVFFRAKDVLKSGRMHDMAVSFNVPDSPRTSGTMLTGARANVRLTALVKGADRYADDYRSPPDRHRRGQGRPVIVHMPPIRPVPGRVQACHRAGHGVQRTSG